MNTSINQQNSIMKNRNMYKTFHDIIPDKMAFTIYHHPKKELHPIPKLLERLSSKTF